MNTLLQPRLFRLKQLVHYTSLSRAFIFEQIKKGDFPKSRKISIGVTVWEKVEVDAWLDQQMGEKA